MKQIFLGILAIMTIALSFYVARAQILFIFKEISAGRYNEIRFRPVQEVPVK